MGSSSSKEQSLAVAIENQDIGELRNILKGLTPDQIRTLCKSYVPGDENQCTILHYATWQDNPDILAPLLEYADDLEMRDGLGWTPLMTAVNRGSRQNVNMLLARGAQINCDWANGMSLIADAMNFDDVELVTILMDHGAQLTPTPNMLANSQDQNVFYLLHYAVDDGLFDIAKVLIERGKIPINTLDQAGWSPLHLAAGHNNTEIVTLLMKNGADVNIKDSHGNTPLAWAREMNATEVIKELEKHGGVADKEWHGDKLEMKSNEERAEEAWEEGGFGEDGGDRPGQFPNNAFESSKFEIEVEDSKSKKQNASNGRDSNVLDALQRQGSINKAVY